MEFSNLNRGLPICEAACWGVTGPHAFPMNTLLPMDKPGSGENAISAATDNRKGIFWTRTQSLPHKLYAALECAPQNVPILGIKPCNRLESMQHAAIGVRTKDRGFSAEENSMIPRKRDFWLIPVTSRTIIWGQIVFKFIFSISIVDYFGRVGHRNGLNTKHLLQLGNCRSLFQPGTSIVGLPLCTQALTAWHYCELLRTPVP
jgi:hypothetical protein